MYRSTPQGRVGERLSAASVRRHKQKQKRQQAEFVCGPIPVDWIARAAALPGRALAVGLAVWFVDGTRRSNKAVCDSLLTRFGVSRWAGYRGLRALEQGGLVTVDRHRGRCPRVAILSANRKVVDNSANSR